MAPSYLLLLCLLLITGLHGAVGFSSTYSRTMLMNTDGWWRHRHPTSCFGGRLDKIGSLSGMGCGRVS
uniref:Natriuretic-like peptide n=1 Tax=Eurycea guttolineata TaxID=332576 RepID=B8R1V3_9SALA|nr:natriuretic-like peptide [Eurycea guttolineata]